MEAGGLSPKRHTVAEQILILEFIFNSGMVNPPKDETVRIRKLLERFDGAERLLLVPQPPVPLTTPCAPAHKRRHRPRAGPRRPRAAALTSCADRGILGVAAHERRR
jgi:hypothetical protein